MKKGECKDFFPSFFWLLLLQKNLGGKKIKKRDEELGLALKVFLLFNIFNTLN